MSSPHRISNMASTLIIKVPNMNCELCSKTIEIELGKLLGVDSVKTSLPTRIVRVVYNSLLAPQEQITQAIDELGYLVSKTESFADTARNRDDERQESDGAFEMSSKEGDAGHDGQNDSVADSQTDFERSEVDEVCHETLKNLPRFCLIIQVSLNLCIIFI